MKVIKRVLKVMMAALCFLCVGMTLLYAYPRYREYEQLRAEAEELRRLIEEEHLAQERIIFDMENSMTDANVERVARERLGLIMSNEIIFINDYD